MIYKSRVALVCCSVLNALLFSQDPVALEAVMCRLIDLDPEVVPTMKPGREWGLGTYLPEEIEWVGDPLLLLPGAMSGTGNLGYDASAGQNVAAAPSRASLEAIRVNFKQSARFSMRNPWCKDCTPELEAAPMIRHTDKEKEKLNDGNQAGNQNESIPC